MLFEAWVTRRSANSGFGSRSKKFGNRCYMSFHVFIPINFRLFCAQAYDLSQCGPTTGQGPHVARHSVFCGLQKHSGKIFKSEICWKACEVTFVSLNCLCWITWIMGNIPFLCNVTFYFIYLFWNQIGKHGLLLTLH